MANIDTFISQVTATLTKWVSVHTEAGPWASHMLEYLDDSFNLSDLSVNTSYWNVNLDKLKRDLVQVDTEDVYYCPICQATLFEYTYCDDCEEYTEFTLDPEEVLDLFIEIYDFSGVTKESVEAALVEQFQDYYDCTFPVVCDIVDEVNKHLSEIETAPNNMEKLTAVIKSMSIAHTNGNIIEDYLTSCEFDFDDVLTVREDGLESLFDREYIKEWIAA